MSVILQNIILGISLAAPIGPANIAIIRKGLKKGFLAGSLTGIGVVAADTFYLLIIYFGLSPFFNIAVVQTAIWILGAGILLYMGYHSIKEYVRIEPDHQETKERSSFVEGFLINVSNPMAIVWWTGVFGSALNESLNKSGDKTHALLNSMTIIIGLLAWVFSVALLTHWGKRFLNEKSMRYVSLAAGILLIIFGLKFSYNAILSITSVV